LAGAARVMAAPGANLTGIDFRMAPAASVTVRGHVTAADPEAHPYIQLTLEPRNPLRREWLAVGAAFDRESGDFQVPHVLPGSYEIIARTFQGSPLYYARIPINVGSNTPEPLEVTLAPALSLSGTIALDDDVKAPFETMRVTLEPQEHRF